MNLLPTSIRRDIPASSDDFRLPRWLEVVLGIIIILELLAPCLTHTLGLDGRLQLNMIMEYNNSLASGIMIPNWTSEAFYHFGATTFYFYPPLMFYLAAAFNLIGIHNPIILFQILSVCVTVGSFFSARWLLQFLGATGYRLNVAAALYAFAPLRIAELYMRSSLATHITYLFLPFICGALISIFRQTGLSKTRRILLLGLCCALTALTDVPIAVMVAISAAVAAAVSYKYLSWSVVVEIILALVIAALLAAYHYTSVLVAQPFSRLQDLHFFHRPEDIKLYFHLGPGTYHMVLLYGASAIIGVSYFWFRWKEQTNYDIDRIVGTIGISIIAFILYLDLFPISAVVWNYFSPLQLVQFPWRFYPCLLLLGIIVVGIARSNIMERAGKWIAGIWIVGAVLPIILVIFSIHIFTPYKRPLEDATEYLPIYFNPSVSGDPGDVRGSLHRTISLHTGDPLAVGDISGNERLQGSSRSPYLETYDVVFHISHPVTFHRFYWPFWHLYVYGVEIPSHPDSLGRATATLPAGHYTATWQLERTPLEVAGLWTSGIAWSGVIIFAGIGLVRKRVKATSVPPP